MTLSICTAEKPDGPHARNKRRPNSLKQGFPEGKYFFPERAMGRSIRFGEPSMRRERGMRRRGEIPLTRNGADFANRTCTPLPRGERRISRAAPAWMLRTNPSIFLSVRRTDFPLPSREREAGTDVSTGTAWVRGLWASRFVRSYAGWKRRNFAAASPWLRVSVRVKHATGGIVSSSACPAILKRNEGWQVPCCREKSREEEKFRR
jgi:hypothetical protein